MSNFGAITAMIESMKLNRNQLKNINSGRFITESKFFHKGDQLKQKRRDEKALKNINLKSKRFRATEKWIYYTILIIITGLFITVSYWWFFLV